MHGRAGSFRGNGGEIFGDGAADDTGGIAPIGPIKLNPELTLVVAVVLLIRNAHHIELKGRHTRVMLSAEIRRHRLFQVGLHLR